LDTTHLGGDDPLIATGPDDLGPGPVAELQAKSVSELRRIAGELSIPSHNRLKRTDLVYRILRAQARERGIELGGGILEIIQDGIGFLRSDRMRPGPDDVYVSQSQMRRFSLRTGDLVIGQVRPPKDNEKFQGLLRVDAVNGLHPDVTKTRPKFEKLTPILPDAQFVLETETEALAPRIMDLITPLGRGQRGLIVSPPKAGKTTILKQCANAITENYPEVELMIALIGERPEEVTDMDRSVEAEVISSTFDEPVTDHTRVAEMALERAKRLVEHGRDVVILLDSITRLARAYNLVVPQSGRSLSGGVDPAALYPPKRFFGAARNLEEGGSLTVVATCLVDTGSRMDDIIYEEFKGTGNMELVLSRRLSERRVYPAIDIERSSTRREELLLPSDVLGKVWLIRRMIDMMGGGVEASEAVITRMSQTKSNKEFLSTINKDIV
jgi:transcription termination factor Rho